MHGRPSDGKREMALHTSTNAPCVATRSTFTGAIPCRKLGAPLGACGAESYEACAYMESNPKHAASLAVRDPRIDLWRDPDWQRLWLSMKARPWRSLGIVPAGKGAPADFTL